MELAENPEDKEEGGGIVGAREEEGRRRKGTENCSQDIKRNK